MNAAELNRVEELLLRERERTRRSLTQLRSQAEDAGRDEGDDRPALPFHAADQVAGEARLEQALAIAEQERRYLDGLERALERLHRNPSGFGRCQSCAREIPVERLEVVPHTRFCMDCKARVGEAA